MYLRIAILFAVAPLVLIRPSASEEPSAKKQADSHLWRAIAYPSIPCPWATKMATAELRVPGSDEAQGLQFRLTFRRPGKGFREEGEKFIEPDTKKIELRLHLPNGDVIKPKDDGSGLGDVMAWFGGSLGSTAVWQRTFAWQKNELREAWMELRFPEHVYWLEIPYGFVRNPADPLPSKQSPGRPKFAPAMKTLEKNAKLVNWKFVEYDLGTGITLRHSNPFDADSELILYKGDFSGWDLFTPRSSVSIEQPPDRALVGDCVSISKHGDHLRRSDRFSFPRNPASDERSWGTIVVKVGEKEVRTAVPSSLFKYVHGVADPYHKATLRN